MKLAIIGQSVRLGLESADVGVEGIFSDMFKNLFKKEETGHIDAKWVESFNVYARQQLAKTYKNEQWLATANFVTTPIDVNDVAAYLHVDGKFPSNLNAELHTGLSQYSNLLRHLVDLEIQYYEPLQKLYFKLKKEKKSVDETFKAIVELEGTLRPELLAKIKLPTHSLGDPTLTVKSDFATVKFDHKGSAHSTVSFTKDKILDLVKSFISLVDFSLDYDSEEDMEKIWLTYEDESADWDYHNLSPDDETKFNKMMDILVTAEFQNFEFSGAWRKHLNYLGRALDNLLFKLIKPTMKVSLESFAGENSPYSVEFIAQLAYEAVRQFNKQSSQPEQLPWESADQPSKDSAVAGVMYYMDHPGATAEEVHQQWMQRKLDEGWSCGGVKDVERKEHPCMRPYAELSLEHKLKDHVFMYVVGAFLEAYKEENISRIPATEFAGDYYDHYLDAEPAVGVEGFKELYQSIAKTLKRAMHPSTIEDKADPYRSVDLRAIKNTLGNTGWISTREFVEGEVSAAGIVDRFILNGKVDPTNLLGRIDEYAHSLTWWNQWLPDISKWAGTINTVARQLEKDILANKNDDDEIIKLTKAAIAKIKAIPTPAKTFLKYAKPTLEGTPSKNKVEHDQCVFERYAPSGIQKIPALTKETLPVAAKWIIEFIDRKDPFTTMGDKVDIVGEDFDDYTELMQDADDSLYMDYMDLVYWQSINESYWTPRYTGIDLVDSLIRWVARSVK